MAQLHLHRAHMLTPFTNYLQRFGANVESGLARAKLPVASIDNPNIYVASDAFWNFGYRMERKEGIEALGFLAGEFAGADLVAANFREMLEAAPTLYRGLFLLQKKLETETSGTRFRFTHINTGNIRIIYTITFGPEHPGFNTFILFALAGFLEVLRVYAGPNWQPPEIGLRSTRRPGGVLLQKLPQTQINNSQYNYIDVDVASLCNAPVVRLRDHENRTTLKSETSVIDLRNSVKRLLAGYSGQNYPNIERTAEFSGISVRTLQRQLSETGSSFRALLEEAKFHSASSLLQDTTLPISAVAHQLGYGNPTHFSRAFARITGVSPQAFRRQHQSN